MNPCLHQYITVVKEVRFEEFGFNVLGKCLLCNKVVGLNWEPILGRPIRNNLALMRDYLAVLVLINSKE